MGRVFDRFLPLYGELGGERVMDAGIYYRSGFHLEAGGSGKSGLAGVEGEELRGAKGKAGRGARASVGSRVAFFNDDVARNDGVAVNALQAGEEVRTLVDLGRFGSGRIACRRPGAKSSGVQEGVAGCGHASLGWAVALI